MKTKKKLTTPPKASSRKATPPKNLRDKRIPRPLGVTMLTKEYHKTNNRVLLTKASQLIIDYWVQSNFLYFGQQYNLQQISQLTRMPANRIIKKITDPMKNWLSTDKVEDRFEALVGFVIKNSLGTRAQHQDHINLIRGAQLNAKTGELEYTPFVTGQLTRALELLNTSDMNILRMIEQLKPARVTTAIQVNQAANPQTPNGQYIGINEAVKLLDQNREQALLDSPEKQAKLIAQHADEPLPEIIATRQQGLSIDGSAKPAQKRDHTLRREQEGPIYQDVIIP